MSFKDDFHKGCVKAGGDWVENASDGSFSCSFRNGGTVHCKNEGCWFTSFFEPDSGIVVSPTRAGVGNSVALSPGSSTGIRIDLTRRGVEELLNLPSKKD